MTIKLLLMVDNDPDERLLFVEALEEKDNSIKCITADYGLDALELLDDRSKPLPDIIFLDLNIPKVDGSSV